MKFTITGKKVEVTDALRERIMKKLPKLDRFFQEDSTAHILIDVQRGKHLMEVTIVNNGTIFRAQQVTADVYVSLDEIVDILERQIRKNKTRLEKRLREGAFDFSEPVEAVAEENEFEVIKTKRFSLKPMDVEEAILQMNLLNHTFYVFRDISHNGVCVVYRRKDGGYGLIDPL